DRARERGLDDAVAFVEGNAEALPFPEKSFDAYAIAFGIRNVPRIEAALAEAYRVLKPGARFLCLEFSTVDVPGLDALYDLYSFNVIPALGRGVVGDAEAYRYLVESIRRFPKPQAFAGMIAAAGFRRVSFRPLAGGIVALHSGWRLCSRFSSISRDSGVRASCSPARACSGSSIQSRFQRPPGRCCVASGCSSGRRAATARTGCRPH